MKELHTRRLQPKDLDQILWDELELIKNQGVNRFTKQSLTRQTALKL